MRKENDERGDFKLGMTKISPFIFSKQDLNERERERGGLGFKKNNILGDLIFNLNIELEKNSWREAG